MLLRSTAEGTCADLLLSVCEESGLVHDSEDLVRDSGALKGNSSFASKGFLLSGGHMVGDGHRHEMGLTVLVGNCLHVHGLEELELVHEALKRVCPAFRDSLEVLNGMHVQVEDGHSISSGSLIFSWGLN